MKISNRLLIILAVVCGLAAVILVAMSPGVAQIQIFEARTTINPGDILGTDGNLRTASVSVRDLQSGDRSLVPVSLGALVEHKRCLKTLKPGDRLTLDAIVPGKNASKEKQTTGQRYFRLSGLLGPDTCAISVASDAIISVGYALEPGDVIDLLLPRAPGGGGGDVGGATFRGLRVIAVGGRTTEGWVTSGRHEEKYDTITLAVPAADAEHLAGTFATVGGAKARSVLHSSR